MSQLTAEAPSRRVPRYQLDTGLGRLTPAERAATVTRYRQAMRDFAGMNNLGVWYARADVEEARAELNSELKARQRKAFDASMAKARTRDSMQAVAKLTRVFDRAITDFAAAYADQNEPDHQALVDAVTAGRITAERDL